MQDKENDRVMRRNMFASEPPDATSLDKTFHFEIENIANHHVIEWGERVFALWEGGRAHELDPVTLKTLTNVKDCPAAGLTGNHLWFVTSDEEGYW